MKYCFLVLSLISNIPTVRASDHRFGRSSLQHFDGTDTFDNARVALGSIKSELSTHVNVNNPNDIGKSAGEMLRLIDYASQNGYIQQDTVNEALMEHSTEITKVSLETFEEEQNKRFLAEYIHTMLTEPNTHITVSITIPDDEEPATFFGIQGRQFKAGLFFFECTDQRLYVNTGETKTDHKGIVPVNRVWNLNEATATLKWNEGFSDSSYRNSFF